MSFEPPDGILDIGNATLRVGKLEVAETSGLNQGLLNIVKNNLLITSNTEYASSNTWGIKLPTTWVAEFDVKGHSTTKYVEFNFYNEDKTSNALGYLLNFKDTTLSLMYDTSLSGDQNILATATIPTIVGAFRKVNIFFERGVISVSIDGTRYLYFKETDGFNQGLGVASRVVSATGGAFVNVFIEQDAADSAFKNLRIVNGRFISDKTSNIAFIGGNLGVGVNSPQEALDIRGNMHFERVSNVSQIKVSSNVVAEYTGPHDRPLRKYPEVALTQNDESATSGYTASRSSGSSTYDAWKAFNGTIGGDDWDNWLSDAFYATATGDATVSGAASTTVSGVSGAVIGEWVQLKLPHSIRLQDVRLAPMMYSGTQYATGRTPTKGVVAGSINGTNWELVHSFTAAGLQSFPQNYYASSIGAFNSSKYYDYFRLIIEEVTGGTNGDRVALGEVCFYGHEEGDSSLDTTLKTVYNVPATTGTQLEVYYDAKDLVDGAVTSVTDLSPNTNGGLPSDSPQVSNGAFVFDGVNDYIYNSQSGYTASDAYTASVWVKFLPDAGSSTDPCIFQFGNGSNHSSFGMISDSSENKLRAFIFGNNAVDLIERVDNVWYHLCATYYASNGRTDFFINGILKESVTSGTAMTIPSTPYLSIGVQTDSSNAPISTTYFTGSIANFRLYSKALNADQVKELYDYQKDYFLGSKSQVTLYKGHLGVGVTEPSGQLELAGDERIQEYPPRDLGGFETLVEGQGTYKVSSSSDVTNPSLGGNDHPATAFTANDTFFRGIINDYGYNTGSPAPYVGIHFTNGIGGDFLQIELPYKIYLKSINITARTSSSLIDRAPYTGFIFGSNDSGTTWSQVTSWNGLTWTVGESKSIQINSNTLYSTYRLVANKLLNSTASASRFNIDRWQLFGTPGPTTLDKGSLTLGRSLDVPRVSRYDVDTETPRPEKLVVDFDTTVNSSPTDISGTATHGSFYGGASYSAADKAFKLDGTAGKNIRAATSSFPLNTDIDLSFSLWVKVDVATSTSWRGIWELGNRGASENVGLYIPSSSSSASQGANRFNFSFWGNDCASGEDIVSNRWYHVAGAYIASTKTRHLYVDGILNNTFTSSAGMFSSLDPANPTLVIGSNSTSSYNEGLGGYVSNFKLYKAALEPSEVKKLYNLGRTGRSMVISDTAVGIGKVPEAQLDVRGIIRGSSLISYEPIISHRFISGGDQSVNGNATIPFNGVLIEQPTGVHDGSNFTCPVRGIYLCMFTGMTDNTVGNDDGNHSWFINGSETGAPHGIRPRGYANGTGNAVHKQASSHFYFALNSGDTISLRSIGDQVWYGSSAYAHNTMSIRLITLDGY